MLEKVTQYFYFEIALQSLRNMKYYSIAILLDLNKFLVILDLTKI